MLLDTICKGPDCMRLADGKWESASSYQEILSPLDGTLCGRVPVMTGEEIHKAVEACARAQKKWSEYLKTVTLEDVATEVAHD